MAEGDRKVIFKIKYLLNQVRTWYYFNIKYPWITYNGFVRVMSNVGFARRKIKIGNKVQFGKGTKVASDIKIGNFVLIAGNVSFVGKHDHIFDVVGRTMWESPRGKDKCTIIRDDVWIGNNCTIIAGAEVGEGSIVAAGSVVNKIIPEYEIWGGIPARKIKDRFNTVNDKICHKNYLETLRK